jgi:PadR family transcriptional regulator PadR
MLNHRELYSGLIRLHILHHAAMKPIFGLWIIEELGQHGYKLSPGTVYPLLHGLEKRGYLKSKEAKVARSTRRMYSATKLGAKALNEARQKVHELMTELNESSICQ